jgi:hypothetical protein
LLQISPSAQRKNEVQTTIHVVNIFQQYRQLFFSQWWEQQAFWESLLASFLG